MQLINLNKKTISVDIVSDVVCPWCYVGKKRLEKAMDELKDEYNFEVNYHPFQLDATVPESGIDQKTHFIKKFGSADRVEEIFRHVENAGASVGIDFKFREIPKAINTIGLHQILQVAKEEGIQLAVKQALFEAYMVNPIDLTDRNNIASVLAPFGWNKQKVNEVLDNEELKYGVMQEIKQYQQMGISGVPFFIINNKYGVSGAQPSEMFRDAFKSLKEEDFPQLESASCDVDGNC
ncbi:MAG: DsbA family oxidoreductase [Cytophagales bacterium]